VATGKTGRRTVEIYRVDFEAWLVTKTPGAAAMPASNVIPFARSS